MAISKTLTAIAALSSMALCHPTDLEHDDLFVHTDAFAVQGMSWSNTIGVSYWSAIPYGPTPN